MRDPHPQMKPGDFGHKPERTLAGNPIVGTIGAPAALIKVDSGAASLQRVIDFLVLHTATSNIFGIQIPQKVFLCRSAGLETIQQFFPVRLSQQHHRWGSCLAGLIQPFQFLCR